MTTGQVRFYDGAAYHQTMGKWSQLAGDLFLNWLSPPTGVHWIDIGCGSGAFTELLTERCSPKSVVGVDRSDEQLAYARARPRIGTAQFRQGDAMTLVLFFLPDPTKGLTEMVRNGKWKCGNGSVLHSSIVMLECKTDPSDQT
jgi:SAM-dependent methyltransferase